MDLTPDEERRAEQVGIALTCARNGDGRLVMVSVPIEVLPSIMRALYNPNGQARTMEETMQYSLELHHKKAG